MTSLVYGEKIDGLLVVVVLVDRPCMMMRMMMRMVHIVVAVVVVD